MGSICDDVCRVQAALSSAYPAGVACTTWFDVVEHLARGDIPSVGFDTCQMRAERGGTAAVARMLSSDKERFACIPKNCVRAANPTATSSVWGI